MGLAESKAEAQGRILMLGLDGAGKTTILYALKLNEKVETVPTVGFNIEEVTAAGVTVTIWDCGGQEKLRSTWRYYYKGTQAVIFVVDASDRERVPEAKRELQKLMSEELLKDCSLLVFANKQDLPGALGKDELVAELGVDNMREGLEWQAFATIASENKGLYEGLKWLSGTLPQQPWCTIL
jgi:small GTP-binding protein